MTILFGWNRFRLKSFTFQELNLPELEQFPNATFQVAQSYFHLFYIPVFPMGKRYDLVMNKEVYHVPPSLMKLVDPEKIKARGKWYAWGWPLIVLMTFLFIQVGSIAKKLKREAYAIEFAQEQQKFFDNPEVGDHMRFTDYDLIEFDAEVFKVENKQVILFVNLMNQLDEELMESARNGDAEVDADSMSTLIDYRNELDLTSEFNDSLFDEHPLQPVFRKVLMFQLEGFPIEYKFVKMPLKDYQALKRALGDGEAKKDKKIKIPAFREITKQPLFVEPD